MWSHGSVAAALVTAFWFNSGPEVYINNFNNRRTGEATGCKWVSKETPLSLPHSFCVTYVWKANEGHMVQKHIKSEYVNRSAAKWEPALEGKAGREEKGGW